MVLTPTFGPVHLLLSVGDPKGQKCTVGCEGGVHVIPFINAVIYFSMHGLLSLALRLSCLIVWRFNNFSEWFVFCLRFSFVCWIDYLFCSSLPAGNHCPRDTYPDIESAVDSCNETERSCQMVRHLLTKFEALQAMMEKSNLLSLHQGSSTTHFGIQLPGGLDDEKHQWPSEQYEIAITLTKTGFI